VRRDWRAARAKVELEGACRAERLPAAGGCGGTLQAAHTLGRKYDQMVVLLEGEYLRVDPDDVIPLCERHHVAYDARGLDVLPILSLDEQAAAVRHVGIIRALKRLTGGKA
jgi:hypothetical protein